MKRDTDLDKRFFLSYTCIEYDGFRHARCAWFVSEEEMRAFVEKNRTCGNGFEEELSLEIMSYRKIVL